MRPKFEVGEVVILQSKSHPEASGEYVVLDVIKPFDRIPAEDGSKIHFRSPLHSYKLDVSVVHEGALTSYWQESALRKKHIPGELSFTDLMASLSSPVLITHQP